MANTNSEILIVLEQLPLKKICFSLKEINVIISLFILGTVIFVQLKKCTIIYFV